MKSFAILPLLTLSVSCSAATYYVSSAGSDSNAGTTQSTPWASVNKVVSSALNPGDTVLFRRGDSFCANNAYGMSPTRSGTATSPITYDAYGSGAQPIINACGNRYALGLNGAFYLAFNNLHFTGSTNDTVSIYRTSNLTFNSDTFDSSGNVGIDIVGTDGSVCSNIKVQNSVVAHHPNGAILDTCPGDSITIQNNDIHDNVTSTTRYQAALRVVSDGTSDLYRQTNVLVLGNSVHDNGSGSGGQSNFTGMGIHMDTVGGGMIVQNNYVARNAGIGLEVEWAGTNGSHLVTQNTVIGNGSFGILLYRRSWGVQITHNTSLQNVGNFMVQGENGGDATGMRNIVFSGNWSYLPASGTAFGAATDFMAIDGANNDGSNGSGNTYPNNCLGPDGTNVFRWGTTSFSTSSSLVAASNGALSINCSGQVR